MSANPETKVSEERERHHGRIPAQWQRIEHHTRTLDRAIRITQMAARGTGPQRERCGKQQRGTVSGWRLAGHRTDVTSGHECWADILDAAGRLAR